MTLRLYNVRPVIRSVAAVVLDCREAAGGFDVLLDKTVIFPEGGGQPSDTGRIGSAAVLHAREVGEDVWHLLDKPLKVGSSVEVSFDEARRRDHSVQHTGEHILSGLAAKLFGAKNVGFHMAEDYMTADFDLPLDAEQIKALELEANKAVRDCIPVDTCEISEAEYARAVLRKKAEGLKEPIRVVTVGEADSCTCCGTHCLTSGEVGLIRIDSFARYKGGVRVWFDCGERAVAAAQRSRDAVDTLARRFSVKNTELVAAVIRQGDELAALKHELKKRSARLSGYIAASLSAEAERGGRVPFVLAMPEGLPASELANVAEQLCAERGMIAVLLAEDGATLRYQLMCGEGAGVSMGELCFAVNAAVNGKGGGNAGRAQGSAPMPTGLEETLMQLRSYLRALLK